MNLNFRTDFFKLAIKPHSLKERFRIRTGWKDVNLLEVSFISCSIVAKSIFFPSLSDTNSPRKDTTLFICYREKSLLDLYSSIAKNLFSFISTPFTLTILNWKQTLRNEKNHPYLSISFFFLYLQFLRFMPVFSCIYVLVYYSGSCLKFAVYLQ